MGKKISDVMSYEDDDKEYNEAVAEAVKGGVKKTLRTGRKTKRNERKIGDLSFGQLIWYALFWKLFVPHYAVIVTVAFAAETTLVVMHMAK